MSHRFNLADEPWIPVIYTDSYQRTVSARQVFVDAHLIADLGVSDPFQRFALYRYLIAIGYMIAPSSRDAAADAVEANTGFDRGEIDKFFDEHRERMWLIHDDHPAFQLAPASAAVAATDPGSEKESGAKATTKKSPLKPIGTLPSQVPGESSAAWNIRKRDIPGAVDYPTAALMLTAAWFYRLPGNVTGGSTLGGRGTSSSGSWTSCVRAGETLFATIVSNLVSTIMRARRDGTPLSIGFIDTSWANGDRASLARVARDPLLRSTIAAAANRIFETNPATQAGTVDSPSDTATVTHVATLALPYSVTDRKALLARRDHKTPAGWADPHHPWSTTRGASAKVVRRIIPPGFDGYSTLHTHARDQLTATSSTAGQAPATVCNSSDLHVGGTADIAAAELEVLTVTGRFSAGTVTIDHAQSFRLPASFVPYPDNAHGPASVAAETIAEILGTVFADNSGAHAALRSACKTVVGDADAPAWTARAHAHFAAKVDAAITAILHETIATWPPQPPTKTLLARVASIVGEAEREAFNDTFAVLTGSSRYAAPIAKARNTLATRHLQKGKR